MDIEKSMRNSKRKSQTRKEETQNDESDSFVMFYCKQIVIWEYLRQNE